MGISSRRVRRGTAPLVALIMTSGWFGAEGWAMSRFIAQSVLGQSNLTSRISSPATMTQPSGVFIDPAGHVLVADQGNHRVLIWDSLPAAPSVVPTRILGQPDATANLPNAGGAPSASGLSCPHGVWSDGDRVVVADRGNDRVLVFDGVWDPGAPKFGLSAQTVIGQSSLSAGSNRGCAAPASSAATAATLSFPTGVASDGQRLFVADTANNRVLVWFSFPGSNGQPADLALGQSSLTANISAPAAASTLRGPRGVGTDGSRVAIADTENNRVLIFDSIPAPGDPHGRPADRVVGQSTFTATSINGAEGFLTARTVRRPAGVHLSQGRMLVADTDNNRVLLFKNMPVTNYATPTDEIGHRRFTSRTAGVGDDALSSPGAVTMNQSRIIVADTGNHRATVYFSPLSGGGGVVATVNPAVPLQITVAWTPVPGANGYRIFRDGFWFTDIAGGSSSSFVDTKLSPVGYSYSVAALLSGTEGDPLGTANAIAPAPAVLPGLVVRPHPLYRTYLAEGDSGSANEPSVAPPGKVFDVWVEQIAAYVAPATTINAAIPGSRCAGSEPSSSMGVRIAQEVAIYQPDLVTIGIGTNDLRFGYADTQGAESMKEFLDCLRSAVSAAGPSASRTVVLLSGYHLENWDQMHPQLRHEGPDYWFGAGSDAKLDAWNKAIRDVALHAGVPVAEVSEGSRSAIASEPGRELFLPDRVHANQSGHDVIADSVLSELIPLLGVPGATFDPSEATGHPTTVDEIVTDPSVVFTWAPPATGAPGGYEVQWSPAASGLPATLAYTAGPSIRVQFPSDGLWYLRARALRGSGSPGPWSLAGRVLVDRISPAPPSQPVAIPTEGTNRVVWRWTEPADAGGVSHYEVCWGDDPALLTCDGSATVSATQYEQANLTFGFWYFKVRAVDFAGNAGQYSAPGTWISAGIARF